jgi:hypothetical protein
VGADRRRGPPRSPTLSILSQTAMLVLLPAAAGAGVVPSDIVGSQENLTLRRCHPNDLNPTASSAWNGLDGSSHAPSEAAPLRFRAGNLSKMLSEPPRDLSSTPSTPWLAEHRHTPRLNAQFPRDNPCAPAGRAARRLRLDKRPVLPCPWTGSSSTALRARSQDGMVHPLYVL